MDYSWVCAICGTSRHSHKETISDMDGSVTAEWLKARLRDPDLLGIDCTVSAVEDDQGKRQVTYCGAGILASINALSLV